MQRPMVFAVLLNALKSLNFSFLLHNYLFCLLILVGFFSMIKDCSVLHVEPAHADPEPTEITVCPNSRMQRFGIS